MRNERRDSPLAVKMARSVRVADGVSVAPSIDGSVSIVVRRGRHLVAVIARPHRETGLPSPDAIFRAKMLLALSLAFDTRP